MEHQSTVSDLQTSLMRAQEEIERLRAELLEAQKDLGLLRRARDRRDDEIKRLQVERDYYRDVELGECRSEYQKLWGKYNRVVRGD